MAYVSLTILVLVVVIFFTFTNNNAQTCLANTDQTFDTTTFTGWTKVSTRLTQTNTFLITGASNSNCWTADPCIRLIGISSNTNPTHMEEISIERTFDVTAWAEIKININAKTLKLEGPDPEFAWIELFCDVNSNPLRTIFNSEVTSLMTYSGCFFLNTVSCLSATLRIGGYFSGTEDYLFISQVTMDTFDTSSPTNAPTFSPTLAPTISPTSPPSSSPTTPPSLAPSLIPSFAPTLNPSISPSLAPSLSPTLNPSISPSISPSLIPTLNPSLNPSISPTSPP
eukprot:222476_1